MFHWEASVAIKAALGAGMILRRSFGGVALIQPKSMTDFSINADRESDRFIVDALETAFPDDSIVSEERATRRKDPHRVWYVDGLDGTKAYRNGFPLEVPSASIGLAVDGKPAVGVIFAPFAGKEGELYVAGDPEPAVLNRVIVEVSGLVDLGLATVFHDQGKRDRARIAPYIARLLADDGVASSPSFGGSASCLARVATGKLHGAVTVGLADWDVMAAVVILRMAGAVVTTLEGKQWAPGDDSLVTANPALHEKLLRLLAR